MINPNLLRRGAIYRIIYSSWKTNPRPTVFVLYAGPLKIHALSLNAPGVTSLDAANFASFLKKMKAISGVENWGGRVLYKTLRQYFPNIIRKCYRTFSTVYVGGSSLVSSGILPPESLTSLDKSNPNDALYRDAMRDPIMNRINNLSGTKWTPPPKAPLYQPPVQKKENNPPPVNKIKLDEIKKAEEQKKSDSNRYFSVYGEEE